MLLKIPNLSPLNYYLIATNVHQKYKELKGQEPSKKQCVTRISVISFYTALFTSVIINSYNRILKTSDKDYNSRSDIPSLIFPTNKSRNKLLNSFQLLRFLDMTNSNTCPFSGNNLDKEENIFVWSRFVSEEGRDSVIAFLRDDLGLNMDEVDTKSNDFEMTLSEDANYELEDVLRENGWLEQGDEDDEDIEVTQEDIDSLDPKTKAIYDRLNELKDS